MFEQVRDNLQSGEFRLELVDCQVTQCVDNDPIIFKGVGVVSQNKNGELEFVLVCQGTEGPYDPYAILDNYVSGKLIGDAGLFSIKGHDHNGQEWISERQLINQSHSHSLKITASLSELKTERSVHENKNGKEYCGWYFTGELKLPFRPHEDKFKCELEDWTWEAIKDHHGNVELRFNSLAHEFEKNSRSFLTGISLLAGQSPVPSCSWHIKGDREQISILPQGLRPQGGRLLEFIPREWVYRGYWNAFLNLWIRATHESTTRDVQEVLYHYFHRILKTYQNDMENSVQVIASSIEGLINTLYHVDTDIDQGFVTILEDAIEKISTSDLAVDDRALGVLKSSLKNSKLPKLKVAFRRLIANGVLTKEMLDSWDEVRNKAAHGGLLEPTSDATQTHLDGFFQCYEAFKRIIFDVIKYDGTHRDYSLKNWPVIERPVQAVSESEAEQAVVTPL
ncbi:hypothetical protein ORK51_10560 [Stenotrophomonas rhizophila]|uniref:hypothetical protein n=1 Tax=Stenotrophomonas TaxID=40323 RepID=UPI0015DEE0C9|nr:MULTISPECIES: hypothetical protein [Stenotrophomonas]MCX2920613.1 hypothetical protein [Stenotrophomonas rhizophila]